MNRFPNRLIIKITYYALLNIEKYVLHPGPTERDAVCFKIQNIPEMAINHKVIFKKCLNFITQSSLTANWL